MPEPDKKKKSDDLSMTLGDHLEELRYRLILALVGLAVGVIGSLFFGKAIVAFIQKPYSSLMPDASLVALAPADAFIGYMKICLITGLIFSCPWVFYQLWMFVATGLYPSERRYVKIAVPFSAVLFAGGALFFLFVVAPLSLAFFLKFGTLIDIAPNWTFQKYVSFITMLMLVFGLGFQTPVAIFILNRTNLTSLQTLRNARKYVLLGVFIIAMIATPPDVISQVTLAIPLYGLYELGMLLCRVVNVKKGSEGSA